MTSNSKKLIHSIMITLLLMTSMLSAAFFVTSAEAKPKMDDQVFHDDMRKLWEDHITWTRLVIVSLANDLPDTQTTVNRLLQNQVDIGDAVKPFYGEAAGDQLTVLLTDHIVIAAEVIQAAKAGDMAAFDAALARWYENADDIAEFLNAANPKNWSFEEMSEMMREHLDLTLLEAGTYLGGDFTASVAAYEEVHVQALEMADMLSSGIIRQFPSKFK